MISDSHPPTREDFYDGTCKQLDEWLDGRRDVGLDSDRGLTCGGAGCRDQQTIEEIGSGKSAKPIKPTNKILP